MNRERDLNLAPVDVNDTSSFDNLTAEALLEVVSLKPGRPLFKGTPTVLELGDVEQQIRRFFHP